MSELRKMKLQWIETMEYDLNSLVAFSGSYNGVAGGNNRHKGYGKNQKSVSMKSNINTISMVRQFLKH